MGGRSSKGKRLIQKYWDGHENLSVSRDRNSVAAFFSVYDVGGKGYLTRSGVFALVVVVVRCACWVV
jgi:hypothetical protein